jgi:hypothetical protein
MRICTCICAYKLCLYVLAYVRFRSCMNVYMHTLMYTCVCVTYLPIHTYIHAHTYSWDTIERVLYGSSDDLTQNRVPKEERDVLRQCYADMKNMPYTTLQQIIACRKRHLVSVGEECNESLGHFVLYTSACTHAECGVCMCASLHVATGHRFVVQTASRFCR